MMESFTTNLPAALAACFAMACLVSWPLFKTRRSILMAQLGISAGFSLHYSLLGIWPAAAVGALGALQAVAALGATSGTQAKAAGYALALSMVGAGLWLWTGPTTALSTTAQVLVAIGRMQSNPLALRLLLMSGSLFWAWHDHAVGADVALAADLASVTMGASALVVGSPLGGRLRLLGGCARCMLRERLRVAARGWLGARAAAAAGGDGRCGGCWQSSGAP